MADWKLRLYHQFPPFLRNAAATVRGYELKSWRYGVETEQLVSEALGRDCWSAEQWKSYRENRLAHVLQRAATQVPYYREQWTTRRRNGDKSSFEYLENWPLLEKEAIRQNPHAFLADDCSIKNMFHEHTSGTTGKPLNLWWSKKTVREWYALVEARWRHWYGVNKDTRWAILGGQLVTPVNNRRPPFWVWNRTLNQLYLSSYHLAPDLIPYYLEAIARYEIVYLYCYTSSAYAIAAAALEQGLSAKALQVVVTNAEPVFDYQRTSISQLFQCPVRETYGMSEIVAAAGECEHGRLHLWPEVSKIEVEQAGEFVGNGQAGDLIGTSLLNEDMPLIRYRVGDRGTLADNANLCVCGRTLPQLQGIEGRVDDVLYTVDGRLIGRLDPIFKADLPIQEAQIVQESLHLIRVRYVPTKNFSPDTQNSIAVRLKKRMGDIHIEFEQLEAVPRTNNGKFRAVICNIPPKERPKVR
jgi:phenylacetate-CoA ligase